MKRSTRKRSRLLAAFVLLIGGFVYLAAQWLHDSFPENQASPHQRLESARHFIEQQKYALALEDIAAIPQSASEYQDAQVLKKTASVALEQATAAASEAYSYAIPTQSISSDRVIENLSFALTQQYEQQTSLGVRVTGDDSTKTLFFDCTSDPHPKDVCFMLYKAYPDKREAIVLRSVGVRHLVFSSGWSGGWRKEL